MSLLSHLIRSNLSSRKAGLSKIIDTSTFKSRCLTARRKLSIVKRNEPDKDAPVVFSKSPAAGNPLFVHVDEPLKDDMPWHHPHAIYLSLAVFLLYFLALREENDIDLMLSGDLNPNKEKIGAMTKAAQRTGNFEWTVPSKNSEDQK